MLPESGVTQKPRIRITSQVLYLPRTAPAHVISLVCGITLHGLVPGVQVLRVAAHGEGIHQEGARVVTGAGESLAAVYELFFGPADVRKDEGLQRSDKLMETVLTCFLQAVEQRRPREARRRLRARPW